MRRLGAEEGPGARQAKAALAVLPNVARSRGKEGISHTGQVALRNEHNELALTRCAAAAAEWGELGEAKASGQDLIDAALGIVEGRVRAVDGDAGLEKRQEQATLGGGARQPLHGSEEDRVMRDDQVDSA